MWATIGGGIYGGMNGYAAHQATNGLRYTNHGRQQVMGRDGGRGVSTSAIRHTLNNPTSVTPQSGGRMRYESPQTVVIVNQHGQIITAWAKGSIYTR